MKYDYNNHTLSDWEIDQVISQFHTLVYHCRSIVYGEKNCNNNSEGEWKYDLWGLRNFRCASSKHLEKGEAHSFY